MKLHPILEQNFSELIEICQQYYVERLYAFGSVVMNRFNYETSDLDFVVELKPMEPIEKGENLMNLWTALEELFGRKVDLLTDQPISNLYLRRSIEKSKQLIYDRASQKIFI